MAHARQRMMEQQVYDRTDNSTGGSKNTFNDFYVHRRKGRHQFNVLEKQMFVTSKWSIHVYVYVYIYRLSLPSLALFCKLPYISQRPLCNPPTAPHLLPSVTKYFVIVQAWAREREKPAIDGASPAVSNPSTCDTVTLGIATNIIPYISIYHIISARMLWTELYSGTRQR